jgi:hypothetical protein
LKIQATIVVVVENYEGSRGLLSHISSDIGAPYILNYAQLPAESGDLDWITLQSQIGR